MRPGGSHRFELSSVSASSRFSSFAQPVHCHVLRYRSSGRRLAVLSLDLFNVRHSTRAPAWTGRSAVSQRPQRGGPSQALLASDAPLQKTRDFLAHCGTSVPRTVTHGSPRLAPEAAAVLSLRTRESVLRQERCVADLHYFMGAEMRAGLRKLSAIGASLPSTLPQSLEGSSLHCDSPAAMGPLLCVDNCIDRHASSSTWEELDQRLAMPSRSRRLREFPSASLEVDTAGERGASTDEHLDCAGSSYYSTASSLFRQQQTLFDLRRRLAYLLASGCSGTRSSDKNVLPLRGIFRRAAFALSLAQSTLEVCTWNAGVDEASRSIKGTSSTATRNDVRCQFKRPCGVGEPQSSFLLRHLQSGGRGDLPHVYRYLAQPIELTPAEAYALVGWCADQLCTCARAVAAAAERRNSPEPQSNASDCDPATASAVGCDDPVNRGVSVRSVSPAKVMNSDHKRPGCKGTETGTPREGPDSHEMSDSTLPRSSVSAIRPPSTLWMAERLSRDRISSATSGSHNAWPSPFDVFVASERGEEVVSSATALMGLLSTFVRMTAELALPMADGFSGLSHEEIVSQVQSPTLTKLCDSGESCEVGSTISGGEEFLGRIVGGVVLGVCGALCAVRDSGYLCAYKKKFAGNDNRDAAPSRGGDHRSPTAASEETHGLGQDQLRGLRGLRGRLSFSPAVFEFVLCCERESWSRALQLMERMSEWNGALDALLGVLPSANSASSTSSHLSTFFASPPPSPGADSGPTTAPFSVASLVSVAHLRGLSKETCVMLLYILAQHGRLAEVLGLCEAVLGLDVFCLLHDCSTPDTETSGVDTLIVLIAHLAVANTDPSAAAALVQQVIHSRPVNTNSSAHSDANFSLTREKCDSKAPLRTAALDRMRCVEYVVRAGLTPQRVLSVTEYAMLLHRLLGDQIRDDAARHEPAATALHSATPSSSLGWWLSPSRVWRSGSGLEHRVRAALCLMGFHVNVRHKQTDMLSLEDLYVVLTITRQLARQRDIDIRQLRRRQAESVGVDDDDDDESRSMYQRRWWEDLGVVAGCTKQKQLNSPSSPHKLLPHSLTVTVSSAEMCAASDCCSGSESPAPCHVPRHGGEELLLHLLPARRLVGSPVGVDHIQQLCATCHAALQLFSPVYIESRFLAQKTATPPRLIPGVDAAHRGTRLSTVASSAVLLFLVSHETLSLLRAVRYTQNITVFWSSALSALAAQQLSGQSLFSSAFGLVRESSGFSEHTSLFSPTARRSENCSQQEGADILREEVAYALTRQAEAAVGLNIVATRRLVAPLIALAPYLSAYTVSDLVQRSFRRVFTWQQCLALLPYTLLGSKSQMWLIRRIAQDSEGRRYAFPNVVAIAGSCVSPKQVRGTCLTLSALSTTALETAERMMSVEAAQRRHWGHRRASERADSNATPGAARTVLLRRFVGPPSGSESPASVSADAATHADDTLLALLLEVNWQRALQAFEKAPSRVQVGGGSHVVRLLVAADAWRNLCDAQRRRLVRLAMQSSAHSLGGVSSLLEEMLKTTLDHGLWHSGLYFHRSVAVEQPEIVQQCRRAQRYAALLCQGLLRRTSMTKTVAQMTKAARRSHWAEAAACFLRYATQQSDNTLVPNTLPMPAHPSSDEARDAVPEDAAGLPAAPGSAACEQAVPPLTARTTDVPPTTSEELESLASLIDAEESSSLQHHTSGSSASSSLSPLFNLLRSSSSSSSALISPELTHVAQTARYAMLHTPSLWMRALRWLPQTALPLPFDHERAWRALCADNREKLRALLPAAVQVRVSADEGGISARVSATTAMVEDTVALVSSTTEAALSLVEAARCAHRPQHANEVGKGQQAAVTNALRVLHRAGAWEQATLLYDKAVEANCMPYASSSKVLETAERGGAPWQVTLTYFFRMSQRQRPDVSATAVALQACVEGGQWEVAFRVLRQSLLTQATPVPRLVMLAVNTALQCGVWSGALAAAHQYRRTHNPQLAHTVLLTYVRTQRWDDATEYFYDCTRRRLRPLDASLELAIIASEAASAEYRKTALMVGAIASALEDLYRMSGAVLEHIMFVQRQTRRGALYWQTVPSSSCRIQGWTLDKAADMDHCRDFLFPH